MPRHLIAMIALALTTAACTTPTKDLLQQRLRDRPPAYRDGYLAGCDDARIEKSATQKRRVRDENRFSTEEVYARGWYDGNEDCRDNYQESAADRRHDDTKPVRTEGGW